MLKNIILFYAIILFVAISMQSCCCIHIRDEHYNQHEKLKNDTISKKFNGMTEAELHEWILDDEWE